VNITTPYHPETGTATIPSHARLMACHTTRQIFSVGSSRNKTCFILLRDKHFHSNFWPIAAGKKERKKKETNKQTNKQMWIFHE
jgi:hypothetical protein